jgi:hypothetical protein
VRTRHDLGAVVDDATSECGARGERVLVTANIVYDELVSGEHAAARSGMRGAGGANAQHECARCVEFIVHPRPGTLLCEACEDEVDGDDGASEGASDEGASDEGASDEGASDGGVAMDVDDTPATRAARDAIERALSAIFAGRRSDCSLDELMRTLRASRSAPSLAQVVPILRAMDREEGGSILFRARRIHII